MATEISVVNSTIKVYDTVCHIDDDKVMVIKGDRDLFIKRLKTDKIIVAIESAPTKSGRFYCNFAPTVLNGKLNFTTLEQLVASPL